MSTDDVMDLEDRLRAALAARAELVRPEDLGPVAPVVPLRPRWRSPWVLLATAAAVLLVLGVVLQGLAPDPRSDDVAPEPGPQVELPQDVGRDWQVRSDSSPAVLDLDGDGVDETVRFRAEETKDFDGRIRLETTLSTTGEDAYGVARLSTTIGTYARDPIDADGDGDQELVLPFDSMGGPGEPSYPMVFDLRDGLLVQAAVSDPELLLMGNTPVDGGRTPYYELVRSQTYWFEDGSLYSGRSVNAFAEGPNMTATRPASMVFDAWRWVLDAEGVLRPQDAGCVAETPRGAIRPCEPGARDALPVLGPEATEFFGPGEEFRWTEGYRYVARLEQQGEPTLVVQGGDGRTLEHPIDVADPRVMTTQPTRIFYDGASVVVRSATDPAVFQVLAQDGDALRELAPVGDVPLTTDASHRTWLTTDGALVTVVAEDDARWRAYFWAMVSSTEMVALPAGEVCFADVTDTSTARDC
ncbi:hypothetical protein F4692_002817 [Nocardioides cavernae]|uniref:Uncharacterized protein n=1 Tax=Nocardioides cavernae TaxID=1921566 RepID=A0A7Y9H4A8_9ACTN|nr:hypothetical protein [Nocardioides cavernae]NYE37684.1 hypothetical protein [Nocardioides cavernae]